MNRLQLAKLIEWAPGELESRKRLQKVVYLLQAAGCPLDVEYALHHYGPYSRDVAELTDEMCHAGLLEERTSPNTLGGRTFSYHLPEPTRAQLRSMDPPVDLAQYEGLAKRLLAEPNLKKLEFAATVAYFHRQGGSWEDARRSAAEFKKQDAQGRTMLEAEQLAREVLALSEKA